MFIQVQRLCPDIFDDGRPEGAVGGTEGASLVGAEPDVKVNIPCN